MAGGIKAINTRIGGLDDKIEELDKRLGSNDDHPAAKIDAVEEKLSAKIDDLDNRLDLAQRPAILETKMGELQPKRWGQRARQVGCHAFEFFATTGVAIICEAHLNGKPVRDRVLHEVHQEHETSAGFHFRFASLT